MVSLERLSNEAVDQQTLIALEHRHRYAFAAAFCAGRRVLDLCCGVGYGSAMLADAAASVTGVDVDVAAIDEAERAHGHLSGVDFRVGDAIAYLEMPDVADEFDIVVCFEGIEHLVGGDATLDRLAVVARRGVGLVLSMPNSRRYEEDNAFHLTNFDRDAVDRWATALGAQVLGQWHAAGSLIAPEEDDDVGGLGSPAVPAETRPRGWATNYLLLVNVETDVALPAGAMGWAAEPTNARWLESLNRANRELWGQNGHLGQAQLRGHYGAGAASVIERWRRRAVEAEEQAATAEARREWAESVRNKHYVERDMFHGSWLEASARVGELEHELVELRRVADEREAELEMLRAVRGRKAVRVSLAAAHAVSRLRGGPGRARG